NQNDQAIPGGVDDAVFRDDARVQSLTEDANDCTQRFAQQAAAVSGDVSALSGRTRRLTVPGIPSKFKGCLRLHASVAAFAAFRVVRIAFGRFHRFRDLWSSLWQFRQPKSGGGWSSSSRAGPAASSSSDITRPATCARWYRPS